jgi:branched-chain amino acid transport system substrate-binding protein
MEEIKMKIKKLSALLLSLAMVASMTACGSEATSSASEATSAEAATTSAAETSAAEATTTTNTASGTFKLGGIGPLTGAAAIYGTAAMNGAQIAVDEINALGGDIQFEFNAQDDVHDAETSVNAYHTLQDWGMQVLVGTVTTAPCIAVSAEAYTDRVFCLTPSASSTDVIDGKDNMYQVCFTDPNQGTGAADYIAENIPGTIAVIYQNDDAYSQGIRDTFVAEAAEKGLDVVYEGTFTADTATDFSVQLTAAQAAGAETIFLPMYYTPASVILKQADSMGYAPTFFGVDGMDGILTMEGFDTSLAEGVMLLTPFSADAEDDLTVSFVTKYEEQYGETPNQFAADGYDCVYAIYYALQEAGVDSSASNEEICDALIGVFTSDTFSVDGVTGTGMTWSTDGEVSKAPKGMVIENGVYVGMD